MKLDFKILFFVLFLLLVSFFIFGTKQILAENPSCSNNSDCSGQYDTCIEEHCFKSCSSDSDCPSRQRCEHEIGVCSEVAAGDIGDVTRCRCEDGSTQELEGDHTCRDEEGAVCHGHGEGTEITGADTGGTNGSGGGSSTSVSLTNPLRNINTTQELIAAVINGVMGIIGIAAVAALVYGGILYLTSGGNEEQAGKGKKAITYAIVGLLVSLLSYVIVNAVIRTIGG